MRFIRPVLSNHARRPPALLPVAAALVLLAGCVVASPSRRNVSQDGPHLLLDHRFLIQDAAQRISLQVSDRRSSSQESELPATELSRRDDSALRRNPSSGSVVARLGKGAGSWCLGKSCSSRRITELHGALPGADLSTGFRQPHAEVKVSWPIGQSAAESVVLLRRLLI